MTPKDIDRFIFRPDERILVFREGQLCTLRVRQAARYEVVADGPGYPLGVIVPRGQIVGPTPDGRWPTKVDRCLGCCRPHGCVRCDCEEEGLEALSVNSTSLSPCNDQGCTLCQALRYMRSLAEQGTRTVLEREGWVESVIGVVGGPKRWFPPVSAIYNDEDRRGLSLRQAGYALQRAKRRARQPPKTVKAEVEPADIWSLLRARRDGK